MSESAFETEEVGDDVDNNIDMGGSSMNNEDLIQDEIITENNLEDIDNQEGDWILIENGKRRKIEKIDICISSSEKLPKQFAMAKLFEGEKISGVNRIKYINPFKIIVTLENTQSCEKLILNQTFKAKGWNVYKTWEVGVSYGILRDIDLELSDDELLEAVKNKNDCDILSIKRLNRRSPESGWIPTEIVRICFKGSSRPEYIKLINIRVKVEPFVFPVTQCARCWRFGHIKKFCPSLKIICPKCTGTHENCETNNFKCVNCTGKHMSLAKSCPVYIKEKKIRTLMADFNCTYRKALIMYVPPFSPRNDTPYNNTTAVSNDSNRFGPHYLSSNFTPTRNRETNLNTYSNIVCGENVPNANRQQPPKRKQHNSSETTSTSSDSDNRVVGATDVEMCTRVNGSGRATTEQEGPRQCQFRPRRHSNSARRTGKTINEGDGDNGLFESNYTPINTSRNVERSETFKSLLLKIKNIIFSKRLNWSEKIQTIISISVEWCVSAIMHNILDVSIFQNLFDLFSNNING